MGEFFAFLVRHLYAAIAAVCGIVLVIFGIVQNGLDIRALGLPPWAFQSAGFLLFVGVVIYLLFDWDKKMQRIPSTAEAGDRAPKGKQPPLVILTRARAAASRTIMYEQDDEVANAVATELRASLLTAHKEFGVPVPEIADGYDGVVQGKAFLDVVLPYLQNDHIPEARTVAQQFIDQ